MNASFFHFINIETLIREKEWFNEIFDCLHKSRTSITDLIIKLCHVNRSHKKSWLSIYLFDFVRMWLACHIIVCDVLCSSQSISHLASRCLHCETESRLLSLRSHNKMFFNRIINNICQQIRFHFSHHVFMSRCKFILVSSIWIASQVRSQLNFRWIHFDLSFWEFLFDNCEIVHSRYRKKRRNIWIYVRNWWAQVSSFRVRELFNSSWRKCSNSWSFMINNRIHWIMRVSFSFSRSSTIDLDDWTKLIVSWSKYINLHQV
jgi:hypothetical protein